MGVDSDLAGILREVIQFLESLCDVDLPAKIENAKENLLQRSRTKLSTLASIRESASPGPYLDMNVGKGLLLFPNREDVEEYVGVEEQPAASRVSYQDYYESFQEFGGAINAGKNRSSAPSRKFGCTEEAEEKLLDIYRTFSPATTMNKAHKFGPLDHKIERKSFGFVRGNVRSCWIGLVGSHLLIYSSEKDKQPPEVCSIRGYTGRPANTIIKDQEHAKSAFEIFCPGNKTLQFIARTPKEMEEWLAAIGKTRLIVQDRDSGMYERSMDEKTDQEAPDETASTEERYQDVGGLLSGTKLEKPVAAMTTATPISETVNGKRVARSESARKKKDEPDVPTTPTSPPSLPLRLPRRLPSLPNEDATLTPSYEPLDDGYEEDDIYHKIDDFRGYENVSKKRGKVKKPSKKKEEKKKKTPEIKARIDDIPEHEAYDDVESKPEPRKEETKKNKRRSLFQESPPKKADVTETYDDVQAIVQDTRTPPLLSISASTRNDGEISGETNCRSSSTYDDVLQPLTIDSPGKTETRETKESKEASSTAKSPTKSPQRRWFLDRVRHKKESPRKDEKKSAKDENKASSGKKSDKKEKRKPSLEPLPRNSVEPIEPELPTYDDVSRYPRDASPQNTSQGETTIFSKQSDALANYNSLPRPRPIYVKPNPNPPTVASATIEDLYDDIANYRDADTDPENSQAGKSNFAVTKSSFAVAGNGVENQESRVEKLTIKRGDFPNFCGGKIPKSQEGKNILTKNRFDESGAERPKINANCGCGVAENGVKSGDVLHLCGGKIPNSQDGKSILTKNSFVESGVEKSKNFATCGEVVEIDVKNSNSSTRASTIIDASRNDENQQLTMETGHYQTPRKVNSEAQVNSEATRTTEKEEELYDDVAILAEFRSRRRGSNSSSSRDFPESSAISPVDRITISIKKPWTRFGSNCKKGNAVPSTTVRKKSRTDLDGLDDPSGEKTDPAKPNKLQKLINKMECTLGKQPAKSATSISNKTHSGE